MLPANYVVFWQPLFWLWFFSCEDVYLPTSNKLEEKYWRTVGCNQQAMERVTWKLNTELQYDWKLNLALHLIRISEIARLVEAEGLGSNGCSIPMRATSFLPIKINYWHAYLQLEIHNQIEWSLKNQIEYTSTGLRQGFHLSFFIFSELFKSSLSSFNRGSHSFTTSNILWSSEHSEIWIIKTTWPQ